MPHRAKVPTEVAVGSFLSRVGGPTGLSGYFLPGCWSDAIQRQICVIHDQPTPTSCHGLSCPHQRDEQSSAHIARLLFTPSVPSRFSLRSFCAELSRADRSNGRGSRRLGGNVMHLENTGHAVVRCRSCGYRIMSPPNIFLVTSKSPARDAERPSALVGYAETKRLAAARRR